MTPQSLSRRMEKPKAGLIESYYMQPTRKTRIFFAIAIFFVASSAFVITKGYFMTKGVPQEFRDARSQGASISQNIVDLSNKLSKELENVNTLDKQAQYSQALALTNELIRQSNQIRDEALKLSSELEAMARALPKIKSEEARQAALDSISNRLALITRLLNYSQNLQELLTTLRGRFAGESQGKQVGSIINSINAEVTAINNFNRVATESMDKFDAIEKSSL